MSLCSISDSNNYKPSSNNYLNIENLSKFNNTSLFKNKLSFKINQLNVDFIKNTFNKSNLFISTNPKTPIKITKIKAKTNLNINNKCLSSTSKSYKNLNTNYSNISAKIKNKFNPKILDTEYISRPRKFKKRKISLNIPKCYTFLGNKIKKKTINLNTFDIINGNNCKLFTSTNFNKPIINKSIRDIQIKNKLNFKNNDSISYSKKLLIEKANRSSKKANNYMITQFYQRLRNDKRESLNEYNKYINALQTSLNRSKSKSKIILY